MEANSFPFKEIERDVTTWKAEPELFDPERARQYVHQLQADASEEHEFLPDLYALLGLKRWHHLKRIDPLIKEWIEQGLSVAPLHPDLLYLRVEEIIAEMHHMQIPAHFPVVRESDQKSARKNKAKEIGQLAAATTASIESLQTKLQEIEHGKDQLDSFHQQVISQGLTLCGELLEAIPAAEEAADGFLASITGDFYSREQLRQLQTEVERLNELLPRMFEVLGHHEESEIQKPLQKLDRLIGLKEVKQRVHKFHSYLMYEKTREAQGFSFEEALPLDMILMGRPGTGKTMMARLLADLYHEIGLLPNAHVVEADRSQLVGAYLGQTEEKTMNKIQEAVGGILFIDEAYSLKRAGASGNDYGQTAIDTLVSAMTSEDYAGKFALLLAGYPDEMRQMLDANPGLRSRIPESNIFHLPDYSMAEMLEIGEKIAADNDFYLTDNALKMLRKRLEQAQVDDTFGNARTVKNIIQEAIFQKGARVGGELAEDMDDYALITEEDLKGEEQIASSSSSQVSLEQLIGLHPVKEDMKKLEAFVRVQNERRRQGLEAAPLTLNTLFVGEPGTGKTTVATIYANMLYRYGLIKRGQVLVRGRADLVAGYTGQTALKTKKVVREALGGVLFIDEAYTLRSGSSGDFGQEAIDTLVEEMTKHEENLVVIFAGYPQLMNDLLQTNPGLRSRFKKTFYFPSYSAEELTAITEMKMNDVDYTLSEAAKRRLYHVYTTYDLKGNGRLAKAIAEEAFEQQALRLSESSRELEPSLMLIEPEDIDHAAQNYQKQQLKGD
ncbi:AAA family ATPase [Salsuginibacillus kocurii]|uniref:AAA family ATPase n=1 Tax=Salsuginibacillus kocurii TaxID=427078 RepID=UPI0003824C43|nr:AAA family ATPase [Salsuginibacillus kocurii]